MSREYIWQNDGYFHWHYRDGVQTIAEDYKDDKVISSVAAVLECLDDTVVAIASYHEADSGRDYVLETLLKNKSKLREAVRELENSLVDVESLVNSAVREALRKYDSERT